jgi:hypothetical protein
MRRSRGEEESRARADSNPSCGSTTAREPTVAGSAARKASSSSTSRILVGRVLLADTNHIGALMIRELDSD